MSGVISNLLFCELAAVFAVGEGNGRVVPGLQARRDAITSLLSAPYVLFATAGRYCCLMANVHEARS